MAADPQVATAGVAVPRAGGRADATVAATAALVLLLLVIFVVWPVLRVLGMSLTSPAGLTLAHYAEFFGSWRLSRFLVTSLVVSVVSTVITVGPALLLHYAVGTPALQAKRLLSTISISPAL